LIAWPRDYCYFGRATANTSQPLPVSQPYEKQIALNIQYGKRP
jgi:hypothetical protein